MSVVKVTPESYMAYFGFNYEGISPAAAVHEGSMEFKAAFNAMFDAKFVSTVPITMPMVAHPALAPAFDATGHADAQETRTFLENVLNANKASGVGNFTLGPDLYAVCVRTPTGWLIISGYEISLAGSKWKLDDAVDTYIAANAIPTAQQSALDDLRGLTVMMYTQHERVHLATPSVTATGSNP